MSDAEPEVRWLVSGAAGQLGTALVGQLASRGARVRAHDLDLDVADPAAVDGVLAELASGGPVVVVNAAAFTHVDRCEREPALAERVNAVAPAVLARACAARGARLAHVSTDYVFDGESGVPYREDDPPRPRSVYGRTKLAGERAVLEADPGFLVVRTSWLFGRGRNFPAAILAQASALAPDGALRVVDDQTGRPTYAEDLACGLLALLSAGQGGVYHLANAGTATWWEFARACLDRAGYGHLEIQRIRTQDLDLDAPRPRFSVLDCARAERAGVRLRPWTEALDAYLAGADAPPGVRARGAASAPEGRA